MQYQKTSILIGRLFDRLLRVDKLIEYRAPEALLYKEFEYVQVVLSAIQRTVRKNHTKKGSLKFEDTK